MAADTPTAAFSIRLRVRLRNVPGTLGALAVAIGGAGGNIHALDGFEADISRGLGSTTASSAASRRVSSAAGLSKW